MTETTVHCPSCRGRFDPEPEDMVEEEILECPLCMTELQILSVNPNKVRIFSGDYDF